MTALALVGITVAVTLPWLWRGAGGGLWLAGEAKHPQASAR